MRFDKERGRRAVKYTVIMVIFFAVLDVILAVCGILFWGESIGEVIETITLGRGLLRVVLYEIWGILTGILWFFICISPSEEFLKNPNRLKGNPKERALKLTLIALAIVIWILGDVVIYAIEILGLSFGEIVHAALTFAPPWAIVLFVVVPVVLFYARVYYMEKKGDC